MTLEDISFGNQVAENEAGTLSSYFVETQAWKKLYAGEVDIIFGSKGAGKSALYTLLLANHENIFEQNIFLLSAEKPTGKTVFSDITDEPPTEEIEFVTLWKIYFCQLVVNWLIENELCMDEAREVADKLIDSGLIEETNTLRRLVNSAKTFAKNLMRVESLEGGATLEGGFTGKITFHTPSQEMKKDGYSSVDELLDTLDNHLNSVGKNCWILCDRLDVAFDQSEELEKNALRALFKAYRDIEEYNSIFLKIFLRDDIWSRITEEGFREASHITRVVTISWNSKSLLNLIVSRALQNNSVVEKYDNNPEEVLADYSKQKSFYYKMFPKQVDVGERQSETFEWILSSSIKNAAYEVSKTRIEKTVFAEHPDLKNMIMAFDNKKAEHNIETLCYVWGVGEDEALSRATSLAEIGFFDLRAARNEKLYKIPFIYRFYLQVVQGKAF